MNSTVRWFVSTEPEVATEYAGTRLRDYFTDPDVAVATEVGVRKRFLDLYGYGLPGIESLAVFPVFYTVACILGAKLVFPEDSSPEIAGRVISDLRDIGRLRIPEDIGGAGYVPELVRQYEHLERKSAITGIRPVFKLRNQSPLGTAVVLRGTDLFGDMVTNPSEVKALLEIITETAVRVVRFQRQFTGKKPDEIGMDDDYGGLVSPRIYEEFNYPYIKRIYDEAGTQRRHLHSETFGRGHLPYVCRLGITDYDAWPYHDLTVEDVKEELPDTFFTWNIETTKDLFVDRPDRIKAKFRHAVAAGAPGLPLYICARGVPQANVKAFIEAGQELDR